MNYKKTIQDIWKDIQNKDITYHRNGKHYVVTISDRNIDNYRQTGNIGVFFVNGACISIYELMKRFDGCYDKVLLIGLERESLIHRMAASKEYPDSFIDLQYSYVYVKLAYVAFKMQKYEEADNYFKKYSSTKAALTPDGKCDAAPYLLLTKRYKEVLEKCEDFKNVLKSQDTLNQQYLSVLQKEVAAYAGLNDFKKVAELRESILNIVTHMYRDEVRNAALELDAVYKVNERDKQIAKQDFRLKMHTIFLFFAIGFILLMSFFLWKSWKYNRTIKSKNKVLVRLINEQLSPKENDEIAPEPLSDENREGKTLSENGMEREENRVLFNKLRCCSSRIFWRIRNAICIIERIIL